MGRFFGWLLLLLTGSEIAAAQQGNINVSVFRTSATRGRADICWQINPAALHYQRISVTDSAIAASYETELNIYKDTALVKSDRWLTRTPAVPARQAALLNLLDGYSQNVPPGKYRVEIRCTEALSPQTAFTLQKSFEVDSPASKILARPQLLDTFYKSPEKESVFVRNGMLSLPLSADFVGDERRDLHFYTEAYEHPQIKTAPKPLRLETRILKGNTPFGRFSRTDTCTFREGIATWYATMPVAKLPSGNFNLQTSLVDAKGKIWAVEMRTFQRSNAAPETDTVVGAAVDSILQNQKETEAYVDISKTFIQTYKPVQLKAILRMVQPIATPEEGLSIKVLSQQGSDPDYVRNFLYSFFKTRMPKDPEGAWKMYSDKVRTVNRLFNIAGRPGYETERGRVYLQYGPPTERTTVYQEAGSRPYEVWRYDGLANGQNNGRFLFFQMGGRLDDFLLLHSTVTGEAQNRAWRSSLYTDGGNERARAETLFPER